LRRVRVEATVATSKPVPKRYAELSQTSFQVKKLVKVRSGAIRSSIMYFNPDNKPTLKPQPTIDAKIPSRIKGS
jgi:hypothetical protein